MPSAAHPSTARRATRNKARRTTRSRRGRPRQPSRNLPFRPTGSRSRTKAALAVELAVTVDDGREKDTRRIHLSGMSAPRRGRQTESQVTRRRLAAARRVSGGCRTADLARLLASIAHGQRLAMLCELLAGDTTHKTLAKLTGLKAGPLYYHIRELRAAGLIGPKVRDLYTLTRQGRWVILGVLALERLVR